MKTVRKINKKRESKNRLIFYILGVSWPVLQFVVFYLLVNFNSISLAFKKYDIDSVSYIFAGFDNFKDVFEKFKEPLLSQAMVNTFKVFGIHLITMFIPIIMSYYLFKKYFLHSFFKVVLFMPSIVASMALVLCFKYFVEIGVPDIMSNVFNKEIQGLITNPNTIWGTILFFSIWFSMGANFLLYAGAMNSISESILEAAQLDGVNVLQEFVYIVFPMIWPTFVTFLVTSFATLFTNQLHLFSFFGSQPPSDSVYTIGYYLYKRANEVGVSKVAEYPFLSAMGIVLTLIVMPLCFGTRWLLNKIGPKTE